MKATPLQGILVGTLVGLLVGLLVTTACLPDTDLTDERGPGFGGSGGDGHGGDGGRGGGGGGGASFAATLVDPADGATEVARNLAAIVVRVVPAAEGDDVGPLVVELNAGDGIAVAGGAGVPVACPEGAAAEGAACVRLELAGTLAAHAGYAVQVHRDGEGDGAGLTAGSFTTADVIDETPPRVLDLTLTPAGPCLHATFRTDEPAAAVLVITVGADEVRAEAGQGTDSFDVAVRITTLPVAAAGAVTVEVTDGARNSMVTAAVAVTTPPALPSLVISEVLANPAGTEPAQEWVELVNLGGAAVSLGGLALGDATGEDELPDAQLPAGGRALIVTSAFDPSGGKDPPAAAGTLLVPVDSRLGADGLSNGGEVVRLLDAGGTIISSYGGWVNVSASSWNGRSVVRDVPEACDVPAAWRRMPSEPTPGF